MLSLLQCLAQERFGLPAGFRQKNSRNRPHILVLFSKRIDEHATDCIDSRQTPKRLRGKQPSRR